MRVTYKPADGDPQVWTLDPAKMSVREAEAVEKATGLDFMEWGRRLGQSALAMRGMLWILQRRDHPRLQFNDVDFAVGEVTVDLDRDELEQARGQVATSRAMGDAERAEALGQLDAMILDLDEQDAERGSPVGKALASSDG